MEWLVFIGGFWLVSAIVSQFNKSSRNTSYVSSTPSVSSILKPKPKRLNVKQLDISQITLSPEQSKLLDILENTNENIFVTGKAGTGKSVLLQFFKQRGVKRLVVVAPTGVAALNVGGQTIHSLFRIKPGFVRKVDLSTNYKTSTLLRNLDCIVIDEISMVRADLMDGMDQILRKAKNNDIPFGGVQMIMFGDLYQLPPVVEDRELHKYFADNHGGFYFFNAHAWKNTPLKIYELNEIQRQKDENFKNILNSIRKGETDENVMKDLNTRVEANIPEDGVIILATTNASVNEINNNRLSKINEELHEYKAKIYGDLKPPYPTEEILRLKKGAQVMFVKNDKEKRWVNGDIGTVASLNESEVKVNLDGIVYSVSQATWNKVRYYYDQEKKQVEEETISSFVQFPLRLAWAITIHKSQGQSYNYVAVDMGDGAFAHGQTYVGLSRGRTLEGLYLKREILREDIQVDQDIINFMKDASILNLN